MHLTRNRSELIHGPLMKKSNVVTNGGLKELVMRVVCMHYAMNLFIFFVKKMGGCIYPWGVYIDLVATSRTT